MAINKTTKRTIQLYIDNKEIDGSVRSEPPCCASKEASAL